MDLTLLQYFSLKVKWDEIDVTSEINEEKKRYESPDLSLMVWRSFVRDYENGEIYTF